MSNRRFLYNKTAGVLCAAFFLAACSEGGSSTPGSADDPNVTTMRCNEVMYNVGGSSADSALEWIEVQIVSGPAIENMTSVQLRLEGAAEYTFPEGSLAVGERIVVANDTAAFRSKYPQTTYPVRLFGPFLGRLDNAG